MTIDGVSQSTGAERLVDVAEAPGGVLLVIRDKGGELARAELPADPLMVILSDQPAGPQEVAGEAGGEARVLQIEVKRNEVLLALGGADAAVGLDDLTDALAGALPAG